jgi:hypothetical protein
MEQKEGQSDRKTINGGASWLPACQYEKAGQIHGKPTKKPRNNNLTTLPQAIANQVETPQ